jgi:hypothetical protein
MPTSQTLKTLLVCVGVFLAWTFGAIFTGVVLFLVMMGFSNSEAIGQGMFLVGAEFLLIPIGIGLGLHQAIAMWWKRSPKILSSPPTP